MIALLFATTFVGGFSLSRVSAGAGDFGVFGEVRYWATAMLFLQVLGSAAKAKIATDLPWRWISLVTLLHGYVALSALWSPDRLQSVGVFADVLLLSVLFLLAAYLFGTSPEKGIEYIFRLVYWSSLALVPFAIVGFQSIESEIQLTLVGAIGFARNMGAGALAAVYLWIKTKKVYWLAPVPVFVLIQMGSGNRSPVLAVAAALLLLFLVSVRKTPMWFRGVLALSILVAVSWRFPIVRDQVAFFFDRAIWRESAGRTELYVASRDVLFSSAWDLFRRNPWTGVGLGGFGIRSATGFAYPHNLILNIAADVGLPGLALCFASLVLLLLRWLRPTTVEHIWAFGMGFYYFIVSMFSGTYYNAAPMWVYFLCFMMPMSSLRRLAPSPRRGTNAFVSSFGQQRLPMTNEPREGGVPS